ncbi:MAG: NrdJb [Gammaproteobacteria bacterium PRO8]|nr:NrdJb [Gammaproteobacteria bacterium PRO8]MCQ3934519.1 NrdJb [Gammaproteobacteria bacterium]
MSKISIDKKIVGYRVEGADARAPEAKTEKPAVREVSADGKVVRMHEKLERPEMLLGSTYKVKTPVSDHAMYVTINDIILNQGTEYEQRRPFEIFINSKNLDHYQWIVALTRLMSAVFRKGGDVTFMVDELKAVFDPRGGYWQPGGKFMPSIIAELGHIVEKHLKSIGLLPADSLDEQQKRLVEMKRKEYEERNRQQDAFSKGHYPDGAQLCKVCNTTAVVMMDGCLTCLACGDSKCG